MGCCGNDSRVGSIPPNERTSILYFGTNKSPKMYKGFYGERYFFRGGDPENGVRYDNIRGLDVQNYVQTLPTLFKLPPDITLGADDYSDHEEGGDENDDAGHLEPTPSAPEHPMTESINLDGANISAGALKYVLDNEIDISGVEGTGANGRIIKRDVEKL